MRKAKLIVETIGGNGDYDPLGKCSPGPTIENVLSKYKLWR